MEKKYIFCQNCGKNGHHYKKCMDPIISNGVICFKIDGLDFEKTKKLFEDLIDIKDKKYVRLKKINGIEGKNIEYFAYYQHNIKFLMVQRKYSLGFSTFMKGKWTVEGRDRLLWMFNQMTKQELLNLLEKSKSEEGFDKLWDEFWIKRKDDKRNYDKEKLLLKEKFYKLVNNKGWNLELYCNTYINNNNSPEWGFPKGRRDYCESNKKCAFREFSEETDVKNIVPLEKLQAITEDLIGTDDDRYRHIYYIGICDNDIEVSLNPDKLESHKFEIGNIGWFSHSDALNLISKSHSQKKEIINNLYYFVINRIIKNISDN